MHRRKLPDETMHSKHLLCAWPAVRTQEAGAASLRVPSASLKVEVRLRLKDTMENQIPQELLAPLLVGVH